MQEQLCVYPESRGCIGQLDAYLSQRFGCPVNILLSFLESYLLPCSHLSVSKLIPRIMFLMTTLNSLTLNEALYMNDMQLILAVFQQNEAQEELEADEMTCLRLCCDSKPGTEIGRLFFPLPCCQFMQILPAGIHVRIQGPGRMESFPSYSFLLLKCLEIRYEIS